MTQHPSLNTQTASITDLRSFVREQIGNAEVFDACSTDVEKRQFVAEYIAECSIADEAATCGGETFAAQILKLPQKRIMVTYVPQDASDAARRSETDVTAMVLGMSVPEIQNLRDFNYGRRAFHGPYSLEVRQSVRDFFGVENLSDITDEKVVAARLRYGLAVDGKLLGNAALGGH
jgi:hypothetical protein